MNEILTDNEIMKNVRCCADNYCKNCSLQGKPYCKNTLFSLAWNTIYNLKAENERLEKHTELYHELKSEAIKEFAEKLKEEQEFHVDECDRFVGFVAVSRIDNLVKEMEAK